MCFNLRYQKVCYHGAITFAVDGNVLVTLSATAAIFSTLCVTYQTTGYPSKLLPLQIFRLFCELWILKVDYVDHKLGIICEKLLSQSADFHSTIEQFVHVVVWYIFPWAMNHD
uniref:Uncharacterized protein n=1 Tax=Lepeophtheirus salmonis TaxID=72036 RepID=A0A0K2UWK1_LEPSM